MKEAEAGQGQGLGVLPCTMRTATRISVLCAPHPKKAMVPLKHHPKGRVHGGSIVENRPEPSLPCMNRHQRSVQVTGVTP